MAGSFSQTIILGNVGKDPEIRTTQGGMKIANLTVATAETWTDKGSGERKERTEWHRVSCMNEALSGIIERFVRKGSKVQIIGQNQTRKWTDQSGVERYTTEIVIGRFNGGITLCGDRQSSDAAPQQSRGSDAQSRPMGSGGSMSDRWSPEGMDDEIPFSPCFD
ncbi:single-stranded DNA-binding protein [Tanticharoenia sakaeratensis]|uniref:Single-stranded DNA-binding protein n=1 Tax=Tanticharoenia sakaeratensis NBRC 103193 TaxID=1231623 RepID=A0A0D6MP57_9PROT|nr:single-stranded DNA-binding protein [Tanticharoenia sakaeratensis]GAN55226.1 single-strand binding protein [Tanticharoenia sakaeratensis NBRC 103193]GBQ23291.1 single-strand DNA binding protein Ssb [Tanticharoenia sakaeratensis NBRC 103193]